MRGFLGRERRPAIGAAAGRGDTDERRLRKHAGLKDDVAVLGPRRAASCRRRRPASSTAPPAIGIVLSPCGGEEAERGAVGREERDCVASSVPASAVASQLVEAAHVELRRVVLARRESTMVRPSGESTAAGPASIDEGSRHADGAHDPRDRCRRVDDGVGGPKGNQRPSATASAMMVAAKRSQGSQRRAAATRLGAVVRSAASSAGWAGNHALEGIARFADVAQALLRVALEAPLEECPHRARRRRGKRAEVDRLAQHRGHRVGDVFALEQPLSGQHLDADDAERPDVGAPVDRLAARLLGRHVGGGAEDRPDLGRAVGQRRRVQRVATRPAASSALAGQVERLRRRPEVSRHLHARGCGRAP